MRATFDSSSLGIRSGPHGLNVVYARDIEPFIILICI